MGKQYVVVRIKGEHGSHLNLVPVGGVMSAGVAEMFLQHATEAEPESVFMLQEVGTA